MTLRSRVATSLHRRLRPTLPLELRERSWLGAHGSVDPIGFARYGEGSWIVPPAHVTGAGHIEIGDGVVVLEQAQLTAHDGARLVVGDRVRFGPFLIIQASTSVVLEADVSGSDNVTIVDSWDNGRRPLAGGPSSGPGRAPVRIGAGAYLGCNAVVGPGVTIGAGAFVGEGAVVLDDVPAHTVVYGNPAQVVRRYDANERRWIGANPVGHAGAGQP
jgi:acetyltransferase-like isoleucine patch superfamily enzyme